MTCEQCGNIKPVVSKQIKQINGTYIELYCRVCHHTTKQFMSNEEIRRIERSLYKHTKKPVMFNGKKIKKQSQKENEQIKEILKHVNW